MKMKNVLMKCGHIANAIKVDTNEPYCIICDCGEVDDKQIDLSERFAKCTECGCIKPSNNNLPFFKYCPEKEYDSFYCGCCGWD